MESGTSSIYLIFLIENVCFPNFKYGVGFILQILKLYNGIKVFLKITYTTRMPVTIKESRSPI